MGFRSDERSQAVLIGAILLFSALVISFSSYQAVIIPDQNEKIEFDHNQRLQTQLLELRNSIVAVDGDSTAESVEFDLSVSYPSRVLAVNPAPKAHTLRTVNTTDGSIEISIQNAKATDAETDDFWDNTEQTYDTGSFVYEPSYSKFTNAPTTVYENTVLINQFDEQTLNKTDQQLINGNRLSLVALDGELSEATTGTTTVSPEYVTTSTTTVTVENDGGPVSITFPTRLSESTWEDLLEDQRVSNGGHIQNPGSNGITLDTAPSPNELTIDLETGETYQLHLAKVGIGTDVDAPSRAYMTTIRGDGTTVPEGGTQKVIVEVRDTYNNPVAGETVTAETALSSSSVSFIDGDTTDEEGRVALEYDAPDDVHELTTDTVQVSWDDTFPGSFDETDAKNVGIDIDVENSDGKIPPPLVLKRSGRIVYGDSSVLAALEAEIEPEKKLDPEIDALGQPGTDITGDSKLDLPYVDTSGNLKIIKADGSTAELETSSGTPPKTSPTRMAVGTWSGTTGVLYATTGDDIHIDNTAGDGTSSAVVTGPTVEAVSGLGDLDNDNNDEIVYVDSNPEVGYYTGSGTTSLSTDIDTANAISAPADLDGDGTDRVVIVTSSNDLEILGDSEGTTSITGPDAKKGPVTVSDVDEDSDPEIVYIGDSNGKLKYVDDPTGTPDTEFLRDIDGQNIDADQSVGVLSE